MANRLKDETSPYLLQHANNPVDWYPYGPEALQEAARRDCPILISIGYSACHWCHVMEHESFSNPAVAEVMNKLFVCIKVDREERPDVDQIYMNAIQLLQGQGGWPLNCFALPDGRPFWGGTYFRPHQWKELLSQLSDLYNNSRDELITQAERIHQGLGIMSVISPPLESNLIDASIIKQSYEKLSLRFDTEQGGLKGAPKFPMPAVWQFVLNYNYLFKAPKAIRQLKLTLEKMAMGGIFDQIGGGFSRYSTDDLWKVPHFEKMLYDNGQLAVLYAQAYHFTQDKSYLNTLTKILQFVSSELTSPEGAFFSAIDADSEGEEGLFYLWRKDQIMELLPEYSDLLSRYWGVDADGKWEKDHNILLRPLTDDEFATREHLSTEELRQLVKMASTVLLSERNKRIRPSLDDKIIFSWNAMMIKGYATAAIVSNNKQWSDIATRAANFLVQQMISEDGRILRTYKDGNARINGFLDDYAFTADAFITLYQLTFDESWLLKAEQLTRVVIDHFSQDDSPLFWYMADDNEDQNVTRLSRILETNDGVEPSGNSMMASVLLHLAYYFENEDWVDTSRLMCNYLKKHITDYPGYYANWASVSAAISKGVTTIAIAGDNAVNLAHQVQKQFHPFVLIAAANNTSSLPVFNNKFKPGKTLIYKCVNHSCDAPVENVSDISF